MPLPDFSAEEKYAINAVRSNAESSNPMMWSCRIGGLLLGGFGVYHNSIRMIVCAFFLVCGFRLYEEWYQRRWLPIWRSVINKYEVAIMAADHAGVGTKDDVGIQAKPQN
jgi:hypothetical protein